MTASAYKQINPKRPVCLIIRDGWGKGNNEPSNGIYAARTPFTDQLEQQWPTTLVETSGLSVGLPAGYQGNSEVGHLNIGAGRIVYQSLTRIDKAIEDGEFAANPALLQAIDTAAQRKSTLHLIGLIQEEGVHAVTRHCLELVRMCKERGFRDVLIHAVTDGRDTPPQSAPEHMDFLQKGLDRLGIGRVATVIGRYYAMDRDKRWDRTQLAYNAIVKGEGAPAENWETAIKDSYAQNEHDEFIKPRIINHYRGMNPNDAVIFFNFRFDRTRQLTQALVEKDFNAFPVTALNLYFVAMTHYYDNGNFREAFPEIEYKNILGEVLANNGLRQLRIAETEKYAHVTFFFNAMQNEPFLNEERILVDSPKVATYDLQPEMSAPEVRERLTEAIRSNRFDVIICNFANCDMVGHTGKLPAIIRAAETVDEACRQATESVLALGGACILTADHGNAEQTLLPDGTPMTSHTTNPVPLTIAGVKDIQLRNDGKLSDIAPTILHLLGIPKPADMTGSPLIL